ncbi:MAG: TIGR02266 family protein [Deltaproteobacteria bacterium]|nr:TIGR02266 family protein [Deltaproteobacteria bacterium]
MVSRKKDRRERDGSVAGEDRRQGRDRRIWQRVLVDMEVDYRCEDTFLFAYITDMSAMGIFVRTNNPEPPGTHLNLRFTLPGAQEPLTVEGVVIWINPYRPGDFNNTNPGMGVRFAHLDAQSKRRVVELVRTIAYLEGGGEAGGEGEESAVDDEDDPELFALAAATADYDARHRPC